MTTTATTTASIRDYLGQAGDRINAAQAVLDLLEDQLNEPRLFGLVVAIRTCLVAVATDLHDAGQDLDELGAQEAKP